jgi:hypothetical protein
MQAPTNSASGWCSKQQSAPAVLWLHNSDTVETEALGSATRSTVIGTTVRLSFGTKDSGTVYQ